MAAIPSDVVGSEIIAAEREFERLYRRYVGDVYRYALAVLRNPVDAEDVTQTTFMNAWRAFRMGEQPRAPQNWFLSIAHNVCRVRFRTLARRPREVEFDAEVAGASVDEVPGADEILDALAELPLNQRAALVMRELEGRSYNEIAQILGVSHSAVETLIFRARRSLRLRASALRSLATVPLPPSLSSFFRNGSALELGAAAALGSGLAVKVATVLVAVMAAAGVGQTAVDAEPREPAQKRVAAAAPIHVPSTVVRHDEAPASLARSAAPAASPPPVSVGASASVSAGAPRVRHDGAEPAAGPAAASRARPAAPVARLDAPVRSEAPSRAAPPRAAPPRAAPPPEVAPAATGTNVVETVAKSVPVPGPLPKLPPVSVALPTVSVTPPPATVTPPPATVTPPPVALPEPRPVEVPAVSAPAVPAVNLPALPSGPILP